MSRIVRTLAAALLGAGTLLSVVATPAAVAASPDMCDSQWSAFAGKPSVSTARAVGLCEIDRRLDDLATVRSKVAGARALTSGDRTAIEHTIDATTSGLHGLRGQVAGDSTLAELQPDLHAIVWDYRVYVLVIRQDWLTYAADGELAAVTGFESFDAKLGGWIERARAAGYDTSAVEADRAAMDADVAAVRSAVAGLPAKLLALTPAGYNAGTAGPTMDAAAETLATQAATLVDARAKGEQAVRDIQALASQ